MMAANAPLKDMASSPQELTDLSESTSEAKAVQIRRLESQSLELQAAVKATECKIDVLSKQIVGHEEQLEGQERTIAALETLMGSSPNVIGALWETLLDLRQTIREVDDDRSCGLLGKMANVWPALAELETFIDLTVRALGAPDVAREMKERTANLSRALHESTEDCEEVCSTLSPDDSAEPAASEGCGCEPPRRSSGAPTAGSDSSCSPISSEDIVEGDASEGCSLESLKRLGDETTAEWDSGTSREFSWRSDKSSIVFGDPAGVEVIERDDATSKRNDWHPGSSERFVMFWQDPLLERGDASMEREDTIWDRLDWARLSGPSVHEHQHHKHNQQNLEQHHDHHPQTCFQNLMLCVDAFQAKAEVPKSGKYPPVHKLFGRLGSLGIESHVCGVQYFDSTAE